MLKFFSFDIHYSLFGVLRFSFQWQQKACCIPGPQQLNPEHFQKNKRGAAFAQLPVLVGKLHYFGMLPTTLST